MTFESAYTGTVRKGDLISISYENYAVLGIYIGRGLKGSVQYYALYYLWDYYEKKQNLHRYGKSYVNAPHGTRIIKVNVNDLGETTLERYEKAMIYLEQQNFKIER